MSNKNFLAAIKGVILEPKVFLPKVMEGSISEAGKFWLLPIATAAAINSLASWNVPFAIEANPFANNPILLFTVTFAGFFVWVTILSSVFAFTGNFITKSKENGRLFPAMLYTEATVYFFSLLFGALVSFGLKFVGILVIVIAFIPMFALGVYRIYLLIVVLNLVYKIGSGRLVLILASSLIILMIIAALGGAMFVAPLIQSSQADRVYSSDYVSENAEALIGQKITVRGTVKLVSECNYLSCIKFSTCENLPYELCCSTCDNKYVFDHGPSTKEIDLEDATPDAPIISCRRMGGDDFLTCKPNLKDTNYTFTGKLKKTDDAYTFYASSYNEYGFLCEQCNELLSNFTKGPIETCNEIKNFYKKALCYNKLLDGTSDRSFCEKTEYFKDKPGCYTKLAVKFNDLSECNKISDETQKGGCYETIALLSKNEAICSQITSPGMQAVCYSDYTIDNKKKDGEATK